MSDAGFTSATRALLAAAKSDAPSAAARAKIWNGVTAGAAGAAGAAAGACAGVAATQSTLQPLAIASTSSAKLLLVGALFGSAVTVGLALAIIRVGPAVAPVDPGSSGALRASQSEVENSPPPMPLSLDTQRADAPGISAATPRATPLPNARRAVEPRHVPHGTALSRAVVSSSGASPAKVAAEDSLMREAAVVAEARGAIMRGDAGGALRLLRTASELGARGLEPEELSLSAHALRMLGREAEAAAIDSDLKMRYPDHALSR